MVAAAGSDCFDDLWTPVACQGSVKKCPEKTCHITLSRVPPKTLLGKALNYLNNQWEKLIHYCDEGYLRMDNNLAENATRPFVVGRKVWLFSNSTAGAKVSANLYSLVETAKACVLEPCHYLKTVFTYLSGAESVADIEQLLPWNQKPV